VPVSARALPTVLILLAAVGAAQTPAGLTIDYPEDGSIFPPDFAAPTFVWRDDQGSVTEWRITISFQDGGPAMEVRSRGERMRLGDIDPRCVAASNRLPELTPQQAAAHTWRPEPAVWAEIKRRSVQQAATITITGQNSRGEVRITASKDLVGAPIFYRDVPLMPTEVEKGVIKPIIPSAVPFISWRLRNVGETSSRVLMEGLPTCANCHSFSSDGKTLAMDVDGPQNDKGMYAIAPISPRMAIRNENVFSWNAFPDKPPGHRTIGFMAQISPDGKYSVTTVNEEVFVANFKDFRFLQVFYPTRGILAYYDRATERIKALPGADNPNFVQTNGFWSQDSKYLVFARARARDAYPEGRPMAQYAGDPLEPPIQYDLYRIPFNRGKGGRATRIEGASQNGMSNTFPKVSPDGKWIVFVGCRNGQLMRPDSQLYIVPAQGGTARRMRCNTTRMNSWHSFSPNGRWLVFSSKSLSPYTQMFLTHIDEDGTDSPPILIENSTAANRAVNIPEFVNVAYEGLQHIDVPAAEFYRLFDSAWNLAEQGRYDESIAEWNRALTLSPKDAKSHNNLGRALAGKGDFEQAIPHWRKAIEIKPDYLEAQNNLGVGLLESGQAKEATAQFQRVLEANPGLAEVRHNLARALAQQGKAERAMEEWRHAIELKPGYVEAYNDLGAALLKQGKTVEAMAAWQTAVRLRPDFVPARLNLAAALVQGARKESGARAVALAEQAARLTGEKDAEILDALAGAYENAGRIKDAAAVIERAISVAVGQQRASLTARLRVHQARLREGQN